MTLNGISHNINRRKLVENIYTTGWMALEVADSVEINVVWNSSVRMRQFVTSDRYRWTEFGYPRARGRCQCYVS